MTEIQRQDVLFVPKRRRMTHTMLRSPEGQDVLHIFYGEKEIIFDEPDLLPFGNRLLEVDRFRAEEATAWSGEAPYDWEKVRPLLEALLAEEILKRFEEGTASPSARTFPPTLGRCPFGREAQTYSSHHDECTAITERTLGRAMDLGNLEVVLPVYRVAHPAIDLDGRQVGENNVAEQLFLDFPTDRRLCNYAGSRYHADAPINQTALKHMTKRWPELLSLTEQFRNAFFSRIPQAGPKPLAGDVHLLAVTCLSSVGYVMVRGVDPVPNRQLDAGLAAMFRLIDGVRIVTTDLTRDTAGTNGCERHADGQAIHEYAERKQLFIDKWGVCAGPGALVDEYLHVLLDGASAPIHVEPDIATRLGDLDAAIDYGFHGVRQEALVRAFGAMQGVMHGRLFAVFAQHAEKTPRNKLRELVEVPIDRAHYEFLRIVHPLEETLEMELRVSGWLFKRARMGLPEDSPGILDSIEDLRRIDPAARATNERRLIEFLSGVPNFVELPEPVQKEVAASATEFFALQRACVRAVEAEQHRLNLRIRRRPGRPITGEDLAAYPRRCTHALGSLFAEGLGLTVTAEAGSTVLTHGDHRLSIAD
jgi:hypothetical protein